jgi:hypothetical protein
MFIKQDTVEDIIGNAVCTAAVVAVSYRSLKVIPGRRQADPRSFPLFAISVSHRETLLFQARNPHPPLLLQ